MKRPGNIAAARESVPQLAQAVAEIGHVLAAMRDEIASCERNGAVGHAAVLRQHADALETALGGSVERTPDKVRAVGRTMRWFIVRIRGRQPEILGPYETMRARRDACLEMQDHGEEVYWLDVTSKGEPFVGRHWRNDHG